MSDLSSHKNVRIGELRVLSKHTWVGSLQLAVFGLTMILPADSARSDYWADFDNDGTPEQHADDEGIDTDTDGLKDGFELYVSFTDPLNWDSDNDGCADGDEYHQNTGVNYWSSTTMNVQNAVTFADIDGDGLSNWLDTYPVDGLNGTGDRDADGIWDMFDAYPDDFWNGDVWMGQPHFSYNGMEYAGSWSDRDSDSIPDVADNWPDDSNNGNYTYYDESWAGFAWIDGSEQWLSGTYSLISGYYVNFDADSDGIPDTIDPYPNDASNNSIWWASEQGGVPMLNGLLYQTIAGRYYAFNGLSGDSDADGIPDFADPYRNDATNNTAWWMGGDYRINGLTTTLGGSYFAGTFVDSDGDGIPDIDDPHPNDARNNTAWFGQAEYQIDGVAQWLTGNLYYAPNGGDSDGDTIPDVIDPYPYDASNNTSRWSSETAYLIDGAYRTLEDRYYATSNGWNDADMDGIPDIADPYSGDSSNNSFWWSGGWYLMEGSVQFLGDRYYASNGMLHDADSDGIPDFADVYVDDALNNTTFINGYTYAGHPFDTNYPDTTAAWLAHWFAQSEGRAGVPLYLSLTQLADTDGDRIPDVLEDFFGLNKQDASDAAFYRDGSAYTNLERYLAWQDLRNPEDPWQYGQVDGIPNVWKVRYGFDLQDPDLSWGDADSDGLYNVTEYWLNTHPLLADTDEDGEEDGAEFNQGNDPTNPGSNQASFMLAAFKYLDLDSDGDGVSDGAEHFEGTNPLDPVSFTEPTDHIPESRTPDPEDAPKFAVFTSHRSRSVTFNGSDEPKFPMSETMVSRDTSYYEKPNPKPRPDPESSLNDGFNGDADIPEEPETEGDPEDVGDPRDMISHENYQEKVKAKPTDEGALKITSSTDVSLPSGPSNGARTKTGRYHATNAYYKPYTGEKHQSVTTADFSAETAKQVLSQVNYYRDDEAHGWQGNGYRGLGAIEVYAAWQEASTTFEHTYKNEAGQEATSSETKRTVFATLKSEQIRLQCNQDLPEGKTEEATFLILKTTTNLPVTDAAVTANPVVEMLGKVTLVIEAGKRLSSKSVVSGTLPDYINVTDGIITANPPEPVKGKRISVSFAAFQIVAHKRGTLNVPGAPVSRDNGEFGHETVMMENGDSESAANSTERDCSLGGSLNDHRKANDDDLVKIILRFPANVNLPGASLKFLHSGMQVDATKSNSETAISEVGNSRLKFYKADGALISNPDEDLQLPDLANPPRGRYISKLVTNGEITIFIEGADKFGDLPISKMARLGGAILKWELQLGDTKATEKLLVYRGGFLRYLQPAGEPGVVGTLQFWDGKGRVRHEWGGKGNEFRNDDTDMGTMLAFWTAKSGKTKNNPIKSLQGKDYNVPAGFGHVPPGWWRQSSAGALTGAQLDQKKGTGNSTTIKQGAYMRWRQDDEQDPAKRYTKPYRYDASNEHDRALGEPVGIGFKYNMVPITVNDPQPPFTGAEEAVKYIPESQNRFAIQIHPDGECNDPVMGGTAGCIGIQTYQGCYDVRDLLQRYHSLKVKVVISQ